ncbi:MAG: hypothetical protein WCT27_04015 [Patescibacteria group bacterium]
MDVISHAAWGATIIRKPHIFWWAALVGLLPDLIIALYGVTRIGWDYAKYFGMMAKGGEVGNTYYRVYNLAHSFIPISIVSAVICIWWPTYWYITLPYYLHIFLDIFTHSDPWGTKFLYPLSNYSFQGWDWWKNKWISIFNWSAVVVVNLIIILFAIKDI